MPNRVPPVLFLERAMSALATTKRPVLRTGLRVRWWWSTTLAGRFAAAGDADLFPQALKPDGPDHDLLADDVAQHAVQAHLLGKLHVLLDGRLDLVTREILLDPRGVEAGLLCRRHGACLVGD